MRRAIIVSVASRPPFQPDISRADLFLAASAPPIHNKLQMINICGRGDLSTPLSLFAYRSSARVLRREDSWPGRRANIRANLSSRSSHKIAPLIDRSWSLQLALSCGEASQILGRRARAICICHPLEKADLQRNSPTLLLRTCKQQQQQRQQHLRQHPPEPPLSRLALNLLHQHSTDRTFKRPNKINFKLAASELLQRFKLEFN